MFVQTFGKTPQLPNLGTLKCQAVRKSLMIECAFLFPFRCVVLFMLSISYHHHGVLFPAN